MKRVVKGHYQAYHFLRLYRDDLEQIVALVKQQCPDVTIVADNYELESLADLEKLHLEVLPYIRVSGHRRPIDDGRLTQALLGEGKIDFNLLDQLMEDAEKKTHDSSAFGSIEVRLTQGGSEVTVSSADCVPLMGVATQIDQVLAPRTRRLFDASTSMVVRIVGAVCFAALFLWAGSLPWRIFRNAHVTQDGVFWLIVMLLTFLLAFAWPVGLTVLRRRSATIIYTGYLHERRSFWQRKKDDIYLAIIIGAIGVVFGVVSTLLVQALTGH